MSVVSGNKVSSSAGFVDIRLKSIQVKAVWGGRATNNYRSLISLADYQYIMPVGSGMMIFDSNARLPKQSQLINANVPGISYVLFMSPSPDLKYLAVVARFKDEDDSAIIAHVYSMDTLIYEYRCPNVIKFKCPPDVHLPSGLKLEMRSLEFSNDNQFVVCTTNHPPIGVLIFDLIKCTLFASVPTPTIPYHASFDPIDPFKICVTGEMGLLAFIRFNMKKVNSPAPALGLKGGKNVSYTCHIWVPTMEGVVVSGSDRGFLCVIEGCEQKHPNNYAFGSPTTRIQTEPPEVVGTATSTDFKPVVQLLLRGDILLALSSSNELAVFELRRVMKSNVNSSAVFLLNKYRLANMHTILGMQWCLLDSLTSFELIAMSRDSVFEFEIARDTAPMLNDVSEIVYTDFIDEKYILRYHWDSIRSLSLSTRTNLLATNSYKDSTTRIWNFNQPTSFTGTWVIENYQDPPDDNPLYVDIHPAGLFTAFAMEYGVKEFAVTDGILQLYRNIDIKTPFIGPNGVPFIINQPVSMVKYSNNGHLLAVVTGKLAQIFSLFLTDYNSPALYGQPTRIMMLTDHIAPITDIAFSRDDSILFTTSSDGSIYSWIVGAYSRHQEYVHRGVSARRVAVTKNHNSESENYIIACYEVQSEMLSDLPIIKQMAKTQKGGDSQQKSTTGSRHGRSVSRLFEAVEESNNNSNKKKSFLAIWKGSAHVSLNPDILQLDCPVRSIALGDADGIEKIDICVLGMADGRILVARLPLPIVRAIDISAPLISAPNTAVSDDSSRLGFGSSSHRHKGGILDQDGGELGRRRDMAINHSTNSRNNNNNKHDNSNDSSTEASVMSILEANKDATTTLYGDDASVAELLDEKSCFQFDIHVGPVNGVVISPNGMWIFSAGDDGVIFMFATSKRGLDITQINDGLENRFHLMDRLRLTNLHTQLSDSMNLVDMNEKDFEIKMNSMIDEKDKVIHDLQVKTLKDLKHRDETILQCRNDYLKLKASVNSEMAAIQRECEATIHDVELTYEQKLSQETLYLDKLKQAYDEFVIHSRLDLNEVQRKTDQRIEAIEFDRDEAFAEVEKQKTVLLQYYDYIQVRNDELFESLEDQQVEERQRLKGELKQTKDDLAIAQSAVLTSEVQASREAQKLMSIIEEKEADLLKLHSRVEWAHGRILELEQVLSKATGDLIFRTEMSEKWELKAGIAQQNVIELEKLRKVLTSQLHNLREEFGPKEETLLRVSGQLEETDREYELSLQAIADKERTLMQKSENLNMLHKQVRDLRNLSSRKDKALRRAATLLEDYKYSLREAYFASEKRTIPVMGYENEDMQMMTPTMEAIIMKRRKPTIIGTEVVEIIAQNEGMKNALKRLNDVLTPFMEKNNNKSKADEEMEDVVQEQERQMEMLHRNVNILQASLDVANNASSHKIENHLRDNQSLLKEVNNLRFEVRSLSMENQRLLAHFEFMNRGANKDDGTTHKPAVPKRVPKVPVPVPTLLRDLEESTTNNFNESYHLAQESKHDDDHDVVDELSQFEMSAFIPEMKVKSNMPRSISLPMFIKPVHDDMVKDKVAAAIMNASAPLHVGDSDAHHDRTYSIPIVDKSIARKMSKSNNSFLSGGGGGGGGVGEGDDSSNPLKNKNEFSRSTADEKIAKLMEMNLQEIKATMKVEVVTKNGTDKLHSSSSYSSAPLHGVSEAVGLGSIASSRQSSQLKTRSSRDSSSNSSSKKKSSSDISLLVTMGKAVPRKELKENNYSKLSAGRGSSSLDQPDRSVHMEESTSTIFNDSVTMLPAIATNSNNNNKRK